MLTVTKISAIVPITSLQRKHNVAYIHAVDLVEDDITLHIGETVEFHDEGNFAVRATVESEEKLDSGVLYRLRLWSQ